MRKLLAAALVSLAFVALMPLGAAVPSYAQEDVGGLRGLLNELLPGRDAPDDKAAVESGPAQSGPERRVPFARQDIQLSFAPLVRETAPAVVNVYAKQVEATRSPFAGDPFFEQFFGRRMPPRVQSSLGSGVIVDPSGIIVTNYHVIGEADDIKVALSDGREYESTILLKDESLDLAVMKIEADAAFPAIGIGDSDALEVGDLVLAIGNPFGVGQTTTSGIVSALARNHIGIVDFGFFIQTDAAINPGNSGGALIDMAGRLVGINTAIYSRTGGSIGIGFAIPSNMVRAVVEAARQGEDHFERPFVGAQFEPVTAQIAEALGMERPAGALVTAVDVDGPAATAGLKPGDVVLALNGAPIEHVDALGYRLATQPMGSAVAFDILSQGAKRKLTVTLARAPEGSGGGPVEIAGESPFAGASVAALSPRLARRLRLPARTTGVAMVEVPRGSPAAGFGFRPRDIVREVNGVPIDTVEALVSAAAENTRWWRLTVERDGQLLRQMLRY
ncbi:Do family serine endopeptidase [Nitratireductor sp. CAU 1489]|uniref:Do family serine endopeptidase n=1 Tax=Nitratireductor arenosus TaxID=2682096 RepID=A0A844QBX2_9HYPH|nr:DegQ family serine endoprotease [Nitratireductor arenosus]MVA97516.1 Do family serine endopeptidase [Nitratireductor arenosus]